MTTGPIIAAEGCSKWYGHVLGVSDVTWQTRGGVIGLLGPNGSGKSTLMKMMAGLLRPSRGRMSLLGEVPYESASARRRVGYCPEHEGLYDELTALEFVTAMAELSGIPRSTARAAAERAIADIGLTEAQHRIIKGFSKGMRQRTKLAQTLVHDPDVILLDEPLTGVDPVARADISARIRQLGEQGKTVIVSSHVLYEIEAITEDILVIYRGQVLAEGNIYEIRSLIDRHPHRIRVECDQPRALARDLAGVDHVQRLSFERHSLAIETSDPDRCYELLNDLVVREAIRVRELSSPDNNLGAVFEYLTGGSLR